MSLPSLRFVCVPIYAGAVVVEEEAQTGARANVLAAAWAAAEVTHSPDTHSHDTHSYTLS